MKKSRKPNSVIMVFLTGAAIPSEPGSPLADAPNLILTPHIAGVTAESNERVSGIVAKLVGDALRA